MNKLQDYIIAENANVLGEQSLGDSVKGIFIGTKAYFFFIPVNPVQAVPKGRKKQVIKSAYSYKGKPVDEFIRQYISQRGLAVSDFERFVLKDLSREIPEVRICAIDDIGQYKVYSKWWGSGILINETTGKTGWKPFVSKFKRAKKEIKAFYQGQPKMVG